YSRGYIMLTVLWMAVGLLLGASAFLSSERTDALSLRAEVESAHALLLARNGANIAMAELAARPRAIVPDGTWTTVQGLDGTLRYAIQDEAGKLSMAQAPVELLRPALIEASRGLGSDAFDAANVAEAIIARRDRAVPLELVSVATILRSLGLTQGAAERAARVLSPFHFGRHVNPMTAPPEVLAVIPGLGPSDVTDIVTRRQTGQPMPRFGTASVWLNVEEGPVYTILAEGVAPSGYRVRMEVLVADVGTSFRTGRDQFSVLRARVVE
ncbi:MAG: hypothetical protein AAFR93_17515, partial [Pseudomonadota bacterium]